MSIQKRRGRIGAARARYWQRRQILRPAINNLPALSHCRDLAFVEGFPLFASALKQSDAEGYAKRDDWVVGLSEHAPSESPNRQRQALKLLRLLRVV